MQMFTIHWSIETVLHIQFKTFLLFYITNLHCIQPVYTVRSCNGKGYLLKYAGNVQLYLVSFFKLAQSKTERY